MADILVGLMAIGFILFIVYLKKNTIPYKEYKTNITRMKEGK